MEAEVEDIFHQEPLSTEQLGTVYYLSFIMDELDNRILLFGFVFFEEELVDKIGRSSICSSRCRSKHRKKFDQIPGGKKSPILDIQYI